MHSLSLAVHSVLRASASNVRRVTISTTVDVFLVKPLKDVLMVSAKRTDALSVKLDTSKMVKSVSLVTSFSMGVESAITHSRVQNVRATS